MIPRSFCITCDKVLEGKQRFYCSDACRKRYKRWSENHPGMSANETVLSQNRPGLSGNRPQKRIILTVEVEYETNGYETGREGWVIKQAVRTQTVSELLKWLKENRPQWTFTVKNSRIEIE